MAAWTESVLTVGTFLGGVIGSIVVALLRAAVKELVAISAAMRKTQEEVTALASTVATHGKTLTEHADLHKQHHANFRRLGIRDTGSGEAAGGIG